MSKCYTSYSEAINEMIRLTELSTPFKLKFIKTNGTIKLIHKALLRKQTPTTQDANGSYKLNYIDQADDNLGNCYIPLITEVNDRKIIIE
ncbi:hypothetical protein [Winogradskyella pulchriflava]|uniref:Uncharacterized protein n=1 Tax=Winogradskyella pulchriflava TaxID=1110688 RepID=A0ABV6QC61_9FLAO